jgi:glycosyltransferase involved in cell wall biosynthesis
MKKLRIAQVGTIWESLPPKHYGGTERVLHGLTEELTRRGHEVTLFATGDSKTSAKLKSTYPRAAYRDGLPWENFLYPFDHMAHAFYHADQFDIIHIHLNRSQDYTALVLADLVKTPVVFTLHFELVHKKHPNWKNWKDRNYFLMKYRDHNFISISNAQRTIPLKYVSTVYNGLDFSHFKMPAKPGRDLVWIGRVCHEKGTKEAIEVAKKTGLNLILAGKIDRQKYAKYTDEVMKMVDGKQIKYIGEVTDSQKAKLFAKAKALINPINWNEPFGLVPIEAMSMGVPVVAFRNGAMPEIIVEGTTGFLVRNVNEMVKAVLRVDDLNRDFIRQYDLSHFSASVMTDNYLKTYEKVIAKNSKRNSKK